MKRSKMKNIKFILLLCFALLVSSSCEKNNRHPNLVYMPNMYYSPAYEPYTKNNVFEDGLSARTPVEGTIKRGFVPYDYPNTNEGYELAKQLLKSSLPKTAYNLAEGKKYYDIYCAVCHGAKGDGQGQLVINEKFLGVPDYSKTRLPDMTEGSIFHVMTYGKGAMGSHASQLTKKERWQIVQYVLELRKKL